ncbi:hypothetical protein L2109_07085 [Citrobacter portucalensis]|nr:hypothetical protein [Citrobacter portucalensis]MBJ9336140.1 hypothetical protein [Citrobacter freundii]MDE9662859.1 hypothetical protein [Citrobacter portucalensis]MDE9673085.1 hypothetical protein [Citrobacter portucalensis]
MFAVAFTLGSLAVDPSVDYQNVDGFIGAIVAEGRATLYELKTVYSLEDAFTLWETNAVPRYNEYLATKHAQQKSQR